MQRELSLTENLANRFLPLAAFVAKWLSPGKDVEGDPAVYMLQLTIIGVENFCLTVQILGAVVATASPQLRRSRGDDGDADLGTSSDSDALEMPEEESDDAKSLASAAETGAESAGEACWSEGEALGPIEDDLGDAVQELMGAEDNERAAYGSLIVWSNGYASAANNPLWPDVKVRVHKQWIGEMGPGHMSKTVTPAHFGEVKPDIRRSLAVCRSWAIWRARQGDFLMGHPTRQRAFDRELDLLRQDLADMGHGGRTGNLRADGLIETWTPDAFA